MTTGDIVTKFCEKWNSVGDESRFATVSWENRHDGGPHEANFLKLDCSLIKRVFGWRPVWNIDKAIEMVVKFSQNRILNPDGVSEEMDTEIAEFFG